jgi:hypothetical protein
MLTGWILIDEEWNYFDKEGCLVKTGITAIMGQNKVSKEKMIAYYQKRATYPAEDLAKGGADSIQQFVEIYIEEAAIEGVRADVAFVQAMLETGFLRYGGAVKIEQFNFAGLGAVDGGANDNSFPDVRTGIRAHIQHLKAYATKDPLVQECVDARYKYVTKGSAPYIEWLGIQENPDKLGWASSKDYGFKIVTMLNEMN